MSGEPQELVKQNDQLSALDRILNREDVFEVKIRRFPGQALCPGEGVFISVMQDWGRFLTCGYGPNFGEAIEQCLANIQKDVA